RVDTRDNTSTGLALELHGYVWPRPAEKVVPAWGTGPFIGVQAGSSNNVINAVGVGWMFGLKLSGDASNHAALNLGIGYAAIPSVQSLGPEFVDGQKAPLDPSGKPIPIRYYTHDSGSFMMMASFTF